MDNSPQQKHQIDQSISIDQSSKDKYLNTGQSTQSGLIHTDNNISQKTDEQSSLFEMNATNQNQTESTQSEFNNTDISISQKIDELSSLVEMNAQNENTEYNSQLDSPVKHNKIRKLLIYMFFAALLGFFYKTIQEEVNDFDEIGKTNYKMLTLTRGKYYRSLLRYLLKNGKKSQDNNHLDINQIKKQSIIDLKFDANLNKFVITKENKGDQDLFEKEYKSLELLKDTNVTLDLVSIIQSDYKFEQIAAKTNLYQLYLKMNDKNTFGLLYFKLLDKLIKMHKKGIAHSDIKPHHIAISFDNEPFFIDFGASISLSDESQYKNYLHYFTPEFNLQVYFETFNPKEDIYQSIQFTNIEQIKLCDMTQLSLTFLYLLCQNNQQQYLFFTKKYNQLFEKLIGNKNKYQYLSDKEYNSKIIVLYQISRILNQADPKINVINEGKDQQFLNDEAHVQNMLDKYNDVLYKNNVYTVKHINKFSILFIYQYDQLGYKLEIDPQNTLIYILSEMKEYKFISEKYKINEYFQDLQNSQIKINDQSLFNIFQYVKISDIKRLNIDSGFDFLSFWKMLLNSKLKDTIDELTIKFYFDSKTICLLNHALSIIPYFYVQELKISSLRKMSCRIIRDTSKTSFIPDINLRLKEKSLQDKNLINDYILLKNTFKIKQMDINLKLIILPDFNILQGLKKEIEQINQEQKYSLNIQFKTFYKDEDHNKIKQFVIETLQIKETRQTLLIKFKDYAFNDLLIWQQIKNTLENINNFYIEIWIINGKFNKEVAHMLQDIQLISDKVKYRFEDEYIQKNEDEYFCKEYLQKYDNKKELEDENYSINVKYCSQPQSDQTLNIVFYKKFNQNEQYRNQLKQKHQEKMNKLEQKVYDKSLETQKDFYEQKDINELNQLNIQYEQQSYVQNFIFENRKVEIKDNIVDIDFIIKQIQNNNHYSEIKILDQFNKRFDFVFKDQTFTEIEIYSDSEDIGKLRQFKQLYHAISNNYNKFKLKEKIWDLPAFYEKIKVNQTMKYQSYNIKQITQYQTDYDFENIFYFLASKKLQQIIKKKRPFNKNKSDAVKYLIKNWSIELDFKNLYKNNQIDQIRNMFINNTFKDSFAHFQNNSIINTILPTQILKHQLLLQIDYESQYIGDSSFNALFEGIEKQFPRSKMYNLLDCGLTGLTLHNIFETVNTQKSNHKLYFDLTKNNISFNEFKYFIDKNMFNNQIKRYAFQIQYSILEQKQDLINSFEDITEIKEHDFPFLWYVQKQSSKQIYYKRIKIVLEFNYYVDRQSIIESQRDFIFNQNDYKYSDIQDLRQMIYFFSIKDKKKDQINKTKMTDNTNSTKKSDYLDFNNIKELIKSDL